MKERGKMGGGGRGKKGRRRDGEKEKNKHIQLIKYMRLPNKQTKKINRANFIRRIRLCLREKRGVA